MMSFFNESNLPEMNKIYKTTGGMLCILDHILLGENHPPHYKWRFLYDTLAGHTHFITDKDGMSSITQIIGQLQEPVADKPKEKKVNHQINLSNNAYNWLLEVIKEEYDKVHPLQKVSPLVEEMLKAFGEAKKEEDQAPDMLERAVNALIDALAEIPEIGQPTDEADRLKIYDFCVPIVKSVLKAGLNPNLSESTPLK